MLNMLPGIKEIGDEEPHYSTKNLIFSFIWAGLAALHKARYNIMKVVQSKTIHFQHCKS